jgi:tetratricopeptide (TPR) repeat protein
MKHLLRLPSILILAALLGPILRLAAADTPTAEEWAPVEAALATNDATAGDRLTALIAAHPGWPDGLRSLAQWQLKRGQHAPALANAQKALALAPGDTAAAAIAIQASGELGRPADAYAIANAFGGARDPDGWVNFYAAAVAIDARDKTKAGLYLSLAMGHAKSPSAEFIFLDARLAELNGDLERAEASLQRATTANPRLWDAWYGLGVMQTRRAERFDGEARADLLAKAEASFLKVTANLPKDHDAWLGLGRAQVSLGQTLIPSNENDGKAKVREAVRSLRNALELQPDLRDAHLNLGVALLVGDNHGEAIEHLLRARALGSTDRALGFNLMLAFQKAGKTAEFEAEARNVQAVSVAEKLTLGMGFFRSGAYELAIQLLGGATADLASDSERLGAVHRYIGHAHAALAEQARKRGGDDAQAVVERELDLARDSWRVAGALNDHSAQHHFMGQETARSSQHGYDAAWQFLGWHSYLSGSGWLTLIGNYGGAMTGGKGIQGMLDHHPLHLAVWGGLVFLSLCLAIAGFVRRSPAPVEEHRRDHEREREREPERPRQVTTTPRPAPAPKAASPRPAPAPAAKTKMRTPEPAKAPAPKPVPQQRLATPKPPVKSTVETEPIERAAAPARLPRVDPGESSALERKITNPDDRGGRRPPSRS